MRLKLEEMTLDQKLGMVLCARRFHDDDMEYILDRVKNRALGCIQGNIYKKETIEKILAAADYPILVINDTETGFPVSDLPKTPLISLAACDNKKYYEAFAKGIVRDAKAAGFNGTWGPVIDILLQDGPCSVHRKLSDDAMLVAKRAEIIARIYKENHYLSCGKHYPGSSKQPYDTHMTKDVSRLSREEIIENNLVPYMYLHERGLLPSIMTTHSIFESLDPEYPASLSKKVISIIRDMGFDGVCFTDSFAMMAILQKYGEENLYGMAIAAGNDIVLPNYRTPVKDCFEYLTQNYKDGMFDEARLDEAVRRVLAAMEFVGETPKNPTPFTDTDEKAFDAIAKDCITAVTDEGISPALTGNASDKLFIILTENDFDESDTREITLSKWYYPNRIADKIKETFPDAGIEFLPEFSSGSDNDRVLTAATKYKEVVFITFCTTAAYVGTDGLTRRTEAVINALAHSDKLSTVVHFGNPFALKYLEHIPRKIFGYLIPNSQLYAMDVLAGKLPAKGKLPFTGVKFN